MGVSLIGAGLAGGVVTWGVKKAASAALNSAKTKATQKATDIAKNKVGDALFGNKVNGVGDLDNGKVDFRGHKRFTAPRPGKIVNFFCGSSVIEADALDAKLKDQAMRAWDEQNQFGKVLEQRAQGIPDAPPLPALKDAKVEKPVNEPISLDTFRAMVNNTKGAKNKGYVRFVKCDGGEGVTLAKVGNKIARFMSWRVNVTAEHNRQMRQLLAETLLSDFGGADEILDQSARKTSRFGAFLDEKLAALKASIINGTNAKNILKRTEVQEALRIYDALFSAESKQHIIDSFLSDCLRECQYVGPDGSVALKVQKFLKTYGSVAEVKNLDDLVAAAKEAKTGAALRAALESIALAFGKMNQAWQQDRQARIFLDTVVASPTTDYRPDQHAEKLGQLKGAILRRLQDEPNPAGDKTLDVADALNRFFEKGKVFDTLVSFHRANYWREVEGGHSLAEAEAKLLDGLSLETLVAEVRNYRAKLNEELAKDEAPTAYQIIRNAKEAELKECLLRRDSLNTRVGVDKELAELKRQIEVLEDEIGWLDEQAKQLEKGALVKDLGDLLKEKDIGQSEAKFNAWSKEALGAVIAAGSQALGKQFHIDYVTQKYLAEKCPNVANASEKSVREIMEKIVADFKAVVTKALAANVRDANDISLGDLIEDLGDYLMSENVTDGLKNEEVKVTDRNPYKAIRNTRQTSPQLFVEGVMRVSVEHALALKLQKGVAFADVKEQIKTRATVVGKQLAKLFAAIAGKDSKLAGYRAYASDTRVFEQMRAITNAQWDAEKAKYRDGARYLLRITLLEPFLNEDLPQLLKEKDADFEKKAQARLNWRVEELMAAFKTKNVQQFYEGALHFDTLKPTEDKSMHALFGVPVKDIATGYTDPQRVGQEFRKAFEKQAADRKQILADAKRASFVLSETEIAPLILNKAEELWRQDVVTHAPGAFKFNIFNTLRAWIQDFLNVADENRQANIDLAWLEKRSRTLGGEVGKFMRNYLAFEKRVVKLCRAEIAKALAASGNATYTQTHDPAVRSRLVDAVLGGFKDSIGTLLKSYLKSPEAMTGYLKDGVRLQDLVRETLGQGVEAKASDALVRVVKNHADIVNGRLANPKLQNEMVATLLNDIRDGKAETLRGLQKFLNPADAHGMSLLQSVSDAVTWAVEHAVEEARQNPVAAYEEDSEAFQAKLVARAQKNLTKVAALFTEQIEIFDHKLAAAFDAQKAKIGKNAALLSYATNAQADLRTEFTHAFCSLALTRAKDENAYKTNLLTLAQESVRTFSERLDRAIALAEGRQVEAFTTLSKSFDENCRNAEIAFALPGVSMEALVLFRKACQETWQDVNRTFGEKMTSPTMSDQEIAAALANAREELRNRIDALAKDYAARLEKSGSVLSTENLVSILADHGVTRANYPNERAFDDALAYLAEEPTVVAFFNNMQEVAILSKPEAIPSARTVVTWENTFVPGFTTYYALRTNQLRLDAQRDEIEAGVTRMTLGATLSVKDVEKIQAAADETTLKAMETAFKVSFDDIQKIGQQVDIDKIGKVSIDVKAALDAAEATMKTLLHDHQLANAREYWIKENRPVVFDAIVARKDGFIVPEGASPAVVRMVESNRKTFEQQVRAWLEQLVRTGEDPELWSATLDKALGDPRGTKVPDALQGYVDDAHVNVQRAYASEEAAKVIDKMIHSVRKQAVKSFFVNRGAKKAVALELEGPVAAVNRYLEAHKAKPVDKAVADAAIDCAKQFETRLAKELEAMRLELTQVVNNGGPAQMPTDKSVNELAERLKDELKNSPTYKKPYQLMRKMVVEL